MSIQQLEDKQTNTPVTNQILDKFEDIDTFITEPMCASRYKTWRKLTIADTVEIKVPSYMYIEYRGMGGLAVIAEHPTLGEFSLSPTLIGDFAPHETSEFEPTLEYFLRWQTDSLTNASYYKDNKNQFYVIGDWTVLVAKKASKPRWWVFSVLSQKASDAFPQKEKELITGTDFKCLLRSTNFL